MRRPLNMILDFIEDRYVREALENLTQYLRKEPFIDTEWQFFEKEYTAAITDDQIAHTLGGVPKDIILTSKIGAGSVTFEYEDFTKNFIVVSTTGAATIRFFAGTYVK